MPAEWQTHVSLIWVLSFQKISHMSINVHVKCSQNVGHNWTTCWPQVSHILVICQPSIIHMSATVGHMSTTCKKDYCSSWSKPKLNTKIALHTQHQHQSPPTHPPQTCWPLPGNIKVWVLVYHHNIIKIINLRENQIHPPPPFQH